MDISRGVRDHREYPIRKVLVSQVLAAVLVSPVLLDTAVLVFAHPNAASAPHLESPTVQVLLASLGTYLGGQYSSLLASLALGVSIYAIASYLTGSVRIDGDGRFSFATPPVALDGSEPRTRLEIDILLVPSSSSTTFDVLAGRLRKAGYRVSVVDGSDWERVPTLLPSIRMVDWVVCSDYSTVMDAAVAGTPCIIYPFSDEQHGFSRVIAESGVDGFQIEHSVAHVIRAVGQHLDPPAYRNGAAPAAQSILTDLR